MRTIGSTGSRGRSRWVSAAGLIAVAALVGMGGCSKGGSSGAGTTTSAGAGGKVPKPDLLAAMVGNEAPNWEIEDHTGKVWRLGDLRGNVVVLITWATW